MRPAICDTPTTVRAKGLRLGALALVLGCTAAMAACGSETRPESDAEPREPPSVGDPGPVHVHGLGKNPKDGALFVATHTGLFRLSSSGARAKRVADRYQDTMGFTVVGPDEFLGSGHPDGRDRLPPFLGLIRTTDAGKSWRPVSLQGEADFHVLEANDSVVYGYGADWETRSEQLLVSRDRGRTWHKRAAPERLLSLAIHPDDPEHVIASGETSVYSSTDGAASWRPGEARTGLLSWPTAEALYLVDDGGRLHSSDDGGRSWTSRGSAGGEPAAFEATAPRELYVALHDGTIKRSADGGKAWRVHYSPR